MVNRESGRAESARIGAAAQGLQAVREARKQADDSPSTSASRGASATSVAALAVLNLTVAHELARALGSNEQVKSSGDDSRGGGVGVDGADGPERWCIIA